MKRPIITLYFNDPMGKWWTQILEAARRAETELNAEIVVIKKTSPEYAALTDKPACPSVFVNEKCIATKCTITYESLKEAIPSDSDL